MSVMLFWSPGICIGISGDARARFNTVDMARNMAAATTEFFEVIFVTQDTVGELSSNRARCFESSDGTIMRMTSRSKNMPAISKSEFVIRPAGFFVEITSARTSSGHSYRKTVGWTASFSPTTIPPDPFGRSVNNANKIRRP